MPGLQIYGELPAAALAARAQEEQEKLVTRGSEEAISPDLNESAVADVESDAGGEPTVDTLEHTVPGGYEEEGDDVVEWEQSNWKEEKRDNVPNNADAVGEDENNENDEKSDYAGDENGHEDGDAQLS